MSTMQGCDEEDEPSPPPPASPEPAGGRSVHWNAQRQGLILRMDSLPLADGGTFDAEHDVVGITQTCDVVRGRESQGGKPANAPNLSVAAIVRLTDGDQLRECQDQQRPRWVALPGLGNDFFADLDFVASVPKNAITYDQLRGCAVDLRDRVQVRDFGRALGRRYSRFAFPESLTGAIRTVQKTARQKYASPNSPRGRTFHKIRELRLESGDDWEATALNLTLHIILEGAQIPGPNDRAAIDEQTIKDQMDAGRRESRDMMKVIDELEQDSLYADTAYRLWVEFGDSLTKDWPQGDGHPTGNLTISVTDVDGFTLAMYDASESFDLQYLSPIGPMTNSDLGRSAEQSGPDYPKVTIQVQPEIHEQPPGRHR